jgi:hypothetical protein
MIPKLKPGSPIIYKNNPEKTLFNMRQLLYYRKTKDLISIEEYDKLMIEYKIMVYEHKIVKLKVKQEEKKE